MGRLHHIALSALALGALVAAAVTGGAPDRAEAAKGQKRPNVIVLMSDDQTAASQSVMKHTNALLGDRGATFDNSFTNWPLCCPSRATFLTGQYAHNHGVLGNLAAIWGLRAPRPRAHAAGLAAALRLLHGRDRQVPQRLRAEPGRRPAGMVGVARDQAHVRLLRRGAARERAGPHLRHRPGEPLQPRPPGDLLDRRVHGQGGPGDQRPGAVQASLLPLRRLPRPAQRRPRTRPRASPRAAARAPRSRPSATSGRSPPSRYRRRPTSTRPMSRTSPRRRPTEAVSAPRTSRT